LHTPTIIQLHSYPNIPPLPPADAHRYQILRPPELLFILLDLTLISSSYKWCIFFGNKRRLLKTLFIIFISFRVQEVPLLGLFRPHASDAEVCGRARQAVRDQVHLRTHLRDHLHRLRCTEISFKELFKFEKKSNSITFLTEN
jgi:hypothetical protein